MKQSNDFIGILRSLPFPPLTLTYQVVEPLGFPDYPGSMLRGLFGAVLMDMEKNEKVGPIGKQKLSALLFQNKLSKNHPWHAEYTEPPRGYWITPDVMNKQQCMAGDTFAVTFTLCGYYAGWFELLLPVFIQMGKTGFGAEKRKCRLLSVSQVHPHGYSRYVWDSSRPKTVSEVFSIGYDDFTSAQFVSNEFRLYMETPFALAKNYDLYGGIMFEKLMDSLARRATLLAHLYGKTDFVWDETYLKYTKSARIAESHLQWNSFRRYSLRRDEEGLIEGYTGMVHYCFPDNKINTLQTYLPLLLTGQYIHAGRNIVFGGGKYTIAHESYRLI